MSTKRRSTPIEPLLFQELEARVLYSADGILSLGGTLDDEQPAQIEVLEEAAPQTTATDFVDAPPPLDLSSYDDVLDAAPGAARELVVIDQGIDGYQVLVDDLLSQREAGRDVDVVLLSTERDGVEQIGAALAGYDNLAALHIVSHGENGVIALGDGMLSQTTLPAYTDAIGAWRDALSENADLLFYGCDLASSSDGRLLVESVSELTGADVAASVDLTGHESLVPPLSI